VGDPGKTEDNGRERAEEKSEGARGNGIPGIPIRNRRTHHPSPPPDPQRNSF